MGHKINLRNYFLHKLFYTPEKKGAKLRPTVKVASPKYHLEPNHNEVEVKKAEGGQDASH